VNATGPPKYHGYVVGSRPIQDEPEEVLWTVKVRTGPAYIGQKFTIDRRSVPDGIRPARDICFELEPLGPQKRLFATNALLSCTCATPVGSTNTESQNHRTTEDEENRK
jgi:hypothetical protein